MKKTHGTGLGQETSRADSAPGKIELHEILRRDHDEVRGLFKKLGESASTEVSLRQELFARLEQELLFHMEAEERFYYTALEQHDAARPRILESYEEHQVARIVIGAFNSLAVDDERWPAKLKVLRHLVQHHMDEEEAELFKVTTKLLGGEMLQEIAEKVQGLRLEPRKHAGSREAE
jgi:hypothetical protein